MPESNNVQDWLREGDELHARLLMEYADVERQIQELESRLGGKAAEINQLARILGKPLMTPGRRVTAELMTPDASGEAETDEGEPVINSTRVRATRATINAKFATERVVATPAASRILDAIPGRNVD